MSRLWTLFEFIQFFFFHNFILYCSGTKIHIPQGTLRGVYNYTGNFAAYLGIPYATVTERFQDPGPPPYWDTIFDAVHDPPNCEQTDRSTNQPTGQQDCLILNIFKPISVHKKRRLPVLIVIPGGGFHFGLNGHDVYHPKYLVQKNIIVVIINYRLGAFGFLCLQAPALAGNSGLKDQVAAIRWVKDNIHYFGGDPQLITLHGQSSGAASANYLLLSSETEGLFQNVILSSGSVLVPYALDNDPVRTASRIASRMGYATKDPDQLLKIYQNASSHDILRASHFNDTNDPLSLYVFRPCIDKSARSLVKESPRRILETALLKRNVSMVIGFNNMEGIKWAERYNDEGLKHVNETFYKIIPYNILFANEEERSLFEAEVKDFYFNNQTVISYDSLINYFSDSIIMYPLIAMTKYLLRANVSVYNYYFEYDSNRNLSKRKTSLARMNGACHTDDIFYYFDPSELRSNPITPTDAVIIDTLTSFWLNVAKKGNPSTQEIQWRASDQSELRFLSIDKKIDMIPLPNKKRMEFWQKIYEKYNSY